MPLISLNISKSLLHGDLDMNSKKEGLIGGIPSTAHGAQIIPLPLFFFLFYSFLGKVRVRIATQGWERGLFRAPQG